MAQLRWTVLLAAAFELGLWLLPTIHTLSDALLLLIGYPVLAALTLDLGVRLRVRGVYGLLALAGLTALLHALLIAPTIGFAELPRTLFTRILGAGAAVTGLALLILLPSRHRPRPLTWIAAVLIGAAWGVWSRWSLELYTGIPAASSDPAFIYAIMIPALIGLLALLSRPTVGGRLTLNRPSWVIVGGAALALFLIRLLTGALDGLALAFASPLIAACLGILYWQRRSKGGTVWDALTIAPPPTGHGGRERAGLVMVGLIASGAGMLLPRGVGAGDPVFVLAALFTVYGFVWLPTLTAMIALRGLGRQLRAGDL